MVLKEIKNIRTWVDKLNIIINIINIIQFINIIKIKINIITIEKNIDLILRVKSIIIVIIIINLGHASPSRPQETWGWKGAPNPSCLDLAEASTQITWVLHPCLNQGSRVRVRTQGCSVRRPDPLVMYPRLDLRLIGPMS